MSDIVLKIKLAGTDETRRVTVSSSKRFTDVLQLIKDLFPTLPSPVTLKYTDDEGDEISVTCDLELEEAFQLALRSESKALRLKVEAAAVRSTEFMHETSQPTPKRFKRASCGDQPRRSSSGAAASSFDDDFELLGARPTSPPSDPLRRLSEQLLDLLTSGSIDVQLARQLRPLSELASRAEQAAFEAEVKEKQYAQQLEQQKIIFDQRTQLLDQEKQLLQLNSETALQQLRIAQQTGLQAMRLFYETGRHADIRSRMEQVLAAFRAAHPTYGTYGCWQALAPDAHMTTCCAHWARCTAVRPALVVNGHPSGACSPADVRAQLATLYPALCTSPHGIVPAPVVVPAAPAIEPPSPDPPS